MAQPSGKNDKESPQPQISGAGKLLNAVNDDDQAPDGQAAPNAASAANSKLAAAAKAVSLLLPITSDQFLFYSTSLSLPVSSTVWLYKQLHP